MLNFTPDQWIIVGLVFVLGLLVGVFLLSGNGRKWKERYRTEVERREAIEADYKASETEWRERDSLREAALKDRTRTRHDVDRDGIDDRIEPGRQHPPGRDPHDVDRDGIDDRIEPGRQRPR